MIAALLGLVVGGRYRCATPERRAFLLEYVDDNGTVTALPMSSLTGYGFDVSVVGYEEVLGPDITSPEGIEYLGVNWTVRCSDYGDGQLNRIAFIGQGSLSDNGHSYGADIVVSAGWGSFRVERKSSGKKKLTWSFGELGIPELTFKPSPAWSNQLVMDVEVLGTWVIGDLFGWELKGFKEGKTVEIIAGEGEVKGKGKKEGITPSKMTEAGALELRSMKVKKAYIGILRSGKPMGHALSEGFRKVAGVGHPVFYHAAVFVTDGGEGGRGAVLEYGGKRPGGSIPSYRFFEGDGASFGEMTLEEFGAHFGAVPIREVWVEGGGGGGGGDGGGGDGGGGGSELTVESLWRGVKGQWRADDYNTMSHNCQDFVVAVIESGKFKFKAGGGGRRWELPAKIAKALRK
jgi:hypothetical protein